MIAKKQQALDKKQRVQSWARWRVGVWDLINFSVACVFVCPLVFVVSLAFFPTENIWPHLLRTVLPGYIRNTLYLVAGVGAGTLFIGTSTAWLVTMYRFPGRGIFAWALLLPMAIPAFILAYVYTDLLDYAGPIQIILRHIFGWTSPHDYYFPEIRSLGGATLMLTLVLYPYIYLLARAAFLEQSGPLLEAATSLGCGPWCLFWRIALPMARPSLAIGLALVTMETLSDFGTVDFFSVRTLTAGIFNVWLLMGNLGGGAQIALVLLAFILLIVCVERYGRRQRRYHSAVGRQTPIKPIVLGGGKAFGAWLICALPLGLGFIGPAIPLLYYTVRKFKEGWTPQFIEYTLNSLMLSCIAALCAVCIALAMAYGTSVRRGIAGSIALFAKRCASFGYAVPGVVLGIGVLTFFSKIDEIIHGVLLLATDTPPQVWLSGSLFALVLAYVIRFFTLSLGTVEAGLGRIKPSLDMAARTLGRTPRQVMMSVHAPLMRSSLLTAVLLVFVDCMKELPLTMLLRPFNFETLTTYIYQFASEEKIEYSALPSLFVVAAGIIPIILLNRSTTRTYSTPRETFGPVEGRS